MTRVHNRLVHKASLLSDLVRTRRQSVFLRDHTPPDEADRTSLHPCLTPNVYEVKLQLVLATALSLRGWRTVVVASDTTRNLVGRYAKAFGLGPPVDYEDFWSPKDEATCRVEAERFLRGELNFQSVKGWTFGDAWIGPQILSTVSRTELRGAPDPRSPETRRRIAELLPSVLCGIRQAERLVDEVGPHLMPLVEANYATYGGLVDTAIASGADVIQVTQPWRDDAFMCRRLTKMTRREHPSSVSRATLDRLSTRPWTDADDASLRDEFARRYGGAWFLQSRNQPATRELDREAIVSEYDLDSAKPLAVVFSHILWDANLFYGEDLFEDYGDWFAQTVRAAAANPAVNWLVKLHPANLWKRALEEVESELSEVDIIRNVVGALPAHVRLLYPDAHVSTLSLYKSADVGVTVRGTPGMEMATFGKPVLTAGTGRYSGLGFTVDSQSREEYLQRLARIQDVGPLSPAETLRAKQHALAVFRLRPWAAQSFRVTFRTNSRGGHPLYQNIEWQVSSVAEMLRRGDLDTWAEWAEGDSIDYVDFGQRSGTGAN